MNHTVNFCLFVVFCGPLCRCVSASSLCVCFCVSVRFSAFVFVVFLLPICSDSFLLKWPSLSTSMVFKFANNVQAGCFGLIIEASRSVFDVAFPLFALQVLDSRSNIFFSALHIGSGVGMLALSQNKIAVWVESLLYPSFFALGMTYLTLGLSPPSFPMFLLVAGVIGLVTSVASISSSVRIQILSRDKPERSQLNALYRVVGIITRIASPLCIGKILDSSNRTARPEEHVAQNRKKRLKRA